jgi:quinol monooxygenase YgiN
MNLIFFVFSLAGFAALFAAIWILHRPLDVHAAPGRAVRNVHRVLEWTMTVWCVALLVQAVCLFLPPCNRCAAPNGNPAMETTNALFRIAEIEVKPEFLDAYLAAARDVGATSVREEPGVLCIFPMQDAERPTSVRILEIYADEAAYKAHLSTPHFRAYKEGTPHMIDSLRLAPMRPLDPSLFPDVFRKTITKGHQP